jgi:hypothetical protein
MTNFKQRWNITSNWQVFVIIVVFAITGSSTAYLSKPILSFFGIFKTNTTAWLYYPLYIVLIFPVYQILLVSIGFLFGQHTFFWKFEKKLLRGIKLGCIASWFER